METRPPYYTNVNKALVTVNRDTYVAVVFAANGLGGAAASLANANSSNRGALDSNEDIDILHGNAEKAEEGSSGEGTRLKG